MLYINIHAVVLCSVLCHYYYYYYSIFGVHVPHIPAICVCSFCLKPDGHNNWTNRIHRCCGMGNMYGMPSNLANKIYKFRLLFGRYHFAFVDIYIERGHSRDGGVVVHSSGLRHNMSTGSHLFSPATYDWILALYTTSNNININDKYIII